MRKRATNDFRPFRAEIHRGNRTQGELPRAITFRPPWGCKVHIFPKGRFFTVPSPTRCFRDGI